MKMYKQEVGILTVLFGGQVAVMDHKIEDRKCEEIMSCSNCDGKTSALKNSTDIMNTQISLDSLIAQ